MPESVGFQYWKDSSMLLGVSSKNQEKMRDDWENLKNENNFYGRKINKMRKKMKELEEENKKLKEELKAYEKSARNSGEIELRQEQEIKKLKEEFDDKEHWGNTMVAYMDYGDHWCHFDRWFGENIDEDDKKQEWVKTWMENTEYEDSEEEEE